MNSRLDHIPLSLGQAFWLWLPLAATWGIMAMERPFVNALITRLPEAKNNLAAFGVAVSICMLMESPIFMILSAASALVENSISYRKVFTFTVLLSTALSCLTAVIFSPSVFALLSETALDLPDSIESQVLSAGMILVPIPLFVAYRRFYQGILIRDRKSLLVGLGTIVRFFCMALAGLTLLLYSKFSGASVGALATTFGMLVEAIFARQAAQASVHKLHQDKHPATALSYPEIMRFFAPLAATTTIYMAMEPSMTFFISHTQQALESLAVFPIVNGFIFLFVAPTIGLQEIIISQIGKRDQNRPVLVRLTCVVAAISLILLILALFRPISQIIFWRILGLRGELAELGIAAATIGFGLPLLSVWGIWRRSILIQRRRSHGIGISSALEVGTALLLMWILCSAVEAPGVILAITSMLIGRMIAVMSLEVYYRRLISVQGGAFTSD